MTSPEQALAQRLRELRRRHFGPQGKAVLAQRLGVSLEEYERYERGTIPPGEILVRICEATGEDLQWLLTGVAARGTVVIAGARSRHRDLLARLARVLDQKPELAAPVEAFLDLLLAAPQAPGLEVPPLPEPEARPFIRIFELAELPEVLPAAQPGEPGQFPLALIGGARPVGSPERADLIEPAMEYPPGASRRVELLTLHLADGQSCRCLNDADVANCFPSAFGVRLIDDSMTPMFYAGDAVLVAPGLEPKIGRPALCRVAEQPPARCRVWLGIENDIVRLGRLADGEIEHVDRGRLLWSLEALYRLASAA